MANLIELANEALTRDAERPAIEFEGRWCDWGEVRRVATGVQKALTESGIASDAAVAFVPRNRPAALAALLGLIAQGRTIRMIYAFQSPAGIARDIARLNPAAVIMDIEDLRDEACETGLPAVTLDGMNAALLPGSKAVAGKFEPAPPQIEILTSGTTGPPKHFAIPYTLLEKHFLATPLTKQQGEDAQTATPFLLYFPLGNISGIYSTLPMLIRGQRVELLERFSIESWRNHVVRYRPAHSGLPPSMVQAVLDANIPREDLSSIKAMGAGAAPLDPAVQVAFEDRYGIPILISYGATEFAGPVAMMTAALHAEWGRSKLGTVGRALPGVRLRVIDPDSGAELPPGSDGLLEVISPRIGPGWIRTSDQATIDGDGFLFLRGRADGAIMRGGFKLLPETIERALLLHPEVAEAAVVGIEDPRLGQVPAAAIRIRSPESRVGAELLEAHLRNRLLATHIPAKWLFCNDLPKTPSLKIDRMAVRALFDKRDD